MQLWRLAKWNRGNKIGQYPCRVQRSSVIKICPHGQTKNTGVHRGCLVSGMFDINIIYKEICKVSMQMVLSCGTRQSLNP